MKIRNYLFALALGIFAVNASAGEIIQYDQKLTQDIGIYTVTPTVSWVDRGVKTMTLSVSALNLPETASKRLGTVRVFIGNKKAFEQTFYLTPNGVVPNVVVIPWDIDGKEVSKYEIETDATNKLTWNFSFSTYL